MCTNDVTKIYNSDIPTVPRSALGFAPRFFH